MENQDVIVIGAGAAGLAAAAALNGSDHSVLLLEARDRLGGRIWTRLEPEIAAPVELGAEFIHGDSAETSELLRRAGSAAIDTSGEYWSFIDGRLQRRTESLIGKVRAAIEAADVLSRPDMSLEDFLASGHGRALPEEARAMARAFVSGFDAADPRLVSLHSVAQEWRSGGMLDSSQSRPLGGYRAALHALCAALADSRVRLQLQTVVTAVRWSDARLRSMACGSAQPFHATARKAIVTVPLGVLKAPAGRARRHRLHAAAWKPSSPRWQNSFPVRCSKSCCIFRDPSGKSRTAADTRMHPFFMPRQGVSNVLDHCARARAACSTPGSAALRSARLCDLTDEEIVMQAMDCVSNRLRRRPAACRSSRRPRSQLGTLIAGAAAPTATLPTGGSDAREELATPLRGTLFFAGEATGYDRRGHHRHRRAAQGTRAALEVSRHLADEKADSCARP